MIVIVIGNLLVEELIDIVIDLFMEVNNGKSILEILLLLNINFILELFFIKIVCYEVVDEVF